MNVKITSTHSLLAGFHILDALEFNKYTVELDLITRTEDPLEQNIAFLRIRHILEETLANTVFVVGNESEAIEAYTLANIPVAIVGADQVDQVVGLTLHCKLSAVVEGKLEVARLRIKSDKGDNIIYEHEGLESNPFTEAMWEDSWWNSTSPADTTTIVRDSTTVITMHSNEWEELDLHWSTDDAADGAASAPNVVMLDTHRDDAS